MTAVADLDLPTLDPFDATLTGERFETTLRDLREQTWLARAEPFGWLVLDREAAAFFMRTPAAAFPGHMILEVQGITTGPLHERMQRTLLGRKGDDHRRLRRVIQPAFTPKAADAFRPAMREQLTALTEPMLEQGACDAVAALARPYPSRMIATVMGAPVEDAPRLEEWANVIQGQFDPVKVASELPAIEQAVVDFEAYAGDLLDARREQPAGDLISQLLALEISDQEVLDIVSSVLVGGVDTTQSQLAHALRLFAGHPDQWRALGDDPSLAPTAVEEALRFQPIAPFTGRVLVEDVEHRGVAFPQGTLVFACAHTANREDGDAFDISAERSREKPLSFGAGPHFCLGANLARAELQEALAYLAPRLRDLELDGEPVYDTPLGVYGLLELPVRWRGSRTTSGI